MNAKLTMLILALATLGGCQTIYVKDTAGNAINGAAVWTVGEGGSTTFKQTTVFGVATLSISIEPPGAREYLYVSKNGYTPNPYKKIRSAELSDTVVLRQIGGVHPKPAPAEPKASAWDWKMPEVDWDPFDLWKQTDPKTPKQPAAPAKN